MINQLFKRSNSPAISATSLEPITLFSFNNDTNNLKNLC